MSERTSAVGRLNVLGVIALLGALSAAAGCGSVSSKADGGPGTGGSGGGGPEPAAPTAAARAAPAVGSGGTDGGGTTDAPAGPPTITSTIPSNGGTGVNVRTIVTVEFSKPMNQSTVNVTLTPAVTLGQRRCGTPRVTPSRTCLRRRWPSNTMYMVMVTGQDMAGRALTGTTTFSFMTGAPDTTAPTVVEHHAGQRRHRRGDQRRAVGDLLRGDGPTTVTLTVAPTVALGEVTFNDAPSRPSRAARGGHDLHGHHRRQGHGRQRARRHRHDLHVHHRDAADTVPPTVISTVPAATGRRASSSRPASPIDVLRADAPGHDRRRHHHHARGDLHGRMAVERRGDVRELHAHGGAGIRHRAHRPRSAWARETWPGTPWRRPRASHSPPPRRLTPSRPR